jgi:TolB protein
VKPRDPARGAQWAAFFAIATLIAAGCGGTAGPGAPTASPATQPSGTAAIADAEPTPVPPTAGPATDESSATKPSTSGDAPAGALPVGRIVFDSDRSGNLDIWLLEASPTEPRQITTDDGTDRVATLAPDGSAILFTSDRAGGPDSPTGLRAYGLYIVRLDGSAPQHLLGTRSFNGSPVHSPDMSLIAFHSDAEGIPQVYVIATGGPADPVALTDDPVQANMGDWAPDGARIVFSSLRDSTGCSTTGAVVTCTQYNREIYVMDADGSNVVRLTDDPAEDGAPAWSPDGSQIAFQSDRAGGRHIFVMNTDGSDVRQLTFGEPRDGFPSWSPDGEWIAFDRVVTRENIEILVTRLDGSELINVTDNPARDAFPNWGD